VTDGLWVMHGSGFDLFMAEQRGLWRDTVMRSGGVWPVIAHVKSRPGCWIDPYIQIQGMFCIVSIIIFISPKIKLMNVQLKSKWQGIAVSFYIKYMHFFWLIKPLYLL